METPKRWLDDDAPPEIRRLLRAGRAEAPRRSTIERTALLLTSAAVGTATTTAGAATSGTLAWAFTKWGAAAVFGLGLATTTAATVRHYAPRTVASAAPLRRQGPGSAAPQRASRAASEPEPSADNSGSESPSPSTHPMVPLPAMAPSSETAHQTAQATPPAAPRTPDAAARDADRETAPAAVTQPNLFTTPPQTQNGSTADHQLVEEMQYIDRARTFLRAGRASEALRALDEYRHACPSQRLMPEALLLRMQAAHRLGDTAAAVETANDIRNRFPDSPHAARARTLLEEMQQGR